MRCARLHGFRGDVTQALHASTNGERCGKDIATPCKWCVAMRSGCSLAATARRRMQARALTLCGGVVHGDVGRALRPAPAGSKQVTMQVRLHHLPRPYPRCVRLRPFGCVVGYTGMGAVASFGLRIKDVGSPMPSAKRVGSVCACWRTWRTRDACAHALRACSCVSCVAARGRVRMCEVVYVLPCRVWRGANTTFLARLACRSPSC